MRVKDIMTSTVSCVRSSETLSAAAKLMWDSDCGALPVIDDDSRVLGMITDRDICMSAWSLDRAPSDLLVSQSMSRELFSCASSATLTSAENIMRAQQVRRLPVIDEQGRLAGIISLADIVRAADGGKNRDVDADEVSSTLASICQRRPVSAPPFISA